MILSNKDFLNQTVEKILREAKKSASNSFLILGILEPEETEQELLKLEKYFAIIQEEK